jgi:protein-tyrosine-phosphatase
MSEVLLRKWLVRHSVPGDWKVISSGTWVRGDAVLSASILGALEQTGIELAGHRSQSITAELLDASDLVLCMTRFHKEALHAEFPSHAGRIKMLSEMFGERYDVRDVNAITRSECLRVAGELITFIDAAGAYIVELLQG